MFGSIMHARCKTDDGAAAVLAHALEYAETQTDAGLLWTEIGQSDSDPREIFAVIHFRDRAAYMANADRPATDAWYQALLKHLDGEPTWHDVEFVGHAGSIPQAASM